MKTSIKGIHHITAIAGPPQENIEFYTGFLGLRLVKKTVNFDDPYTYHLYYGDETGTPGTILTFFPWADAMQGKPGTGQAITISFSIPEDSVDYWIDRFAEEVIDFETPFSRFGQQMIRFKDPDGLQLELVADPAAAEIAGWADGPVPAEHAVRGFHGVTLALDDYKPTAQLLLEVMGYEETDVDEKERRHRYRSAGNGTGIFVDLLDNPDLLGRMGKGTIHHVAFRVKDKKEQLQWREKLISLGYHVTEVKDRQYFSSIYFREPGGVLFEIATDPPGFPKDEPVKALGTDLKLPPWLESRREMIEKRLPEINI